MLQCNKIVAHTVIWIPFYSGIQFKRKYAVADMHAVGRHLFFPVQQGINDIKCIVTAVRSRGTETARYNTERVKLYGAGSGNFLFPDGGILRKFSDKIYCSWNLFHFHYIYFP